MESKAKQLGTPIGAAARGIVGGLAGALLLSIVSRLLPGLRTRHITVPPGRLEDAAAPTLAQSLTLAQSPGPEGFAEQFAFKVAAGIFGQDIGPHARRAGRAVHLAYGVALATAFEVLQRQSG